MRIVIAPDSFKESASAIEVCVAIETGLRRVWADVEIDAVPMADGGEGTVDALVAATQGRYLEAEVRDPLGEVITARYGILGDGKTAVIEMAAASGLERVPVDRRAPGFTTTFGTGQLMRDAIEQGVARLIVGLGGSATNDAGAGMAQALGYSLLDADNVELPFGGLALSRLDWIEDLKKHPGLAHVEVVGAYDVDNPLCGPEGASFVYGPQKGASPKTVELLDAALRHFGEYVCEEFGLKVLEAPGAGAAGGLGAGLMVFANAVLRPGAEVVAEACRLEQRIEGSDLVITGEGKIDAQTVRGKAPARVVRAAKRKKVPVVAFAGVLGEGAEELREEGVEAFFPICKEGMAREEAMLRTQELLADEAERFALAWERGSR
ncbi:MAG: glycerate kinase [Candidatus Hydrogenedentes bacterium]|nr:glycerate kinase [Candidatus Hydrogenedentota bacterium]